jgi:rRNA maturation protein Nop10
MNKGAYVATFSKNINNMSNCSCKSDDIRIKNCQGYTMAVCNNCGHWVKVYHKAEESIVSVWNKSFSDKEDFLYVKSLIMTCQYCPSQWEARTFDDKFVYIRYRWGTLSLEIDDEVVKVINYGDGLDGVMDTEEMKNILFIKEG